MLKLILTFFKLQILVNRKDGGNLMNDNNTEEILAMDRFITNNITISDGYNYLTYHDVCGIYCNESNDVLLTFVKVCYLPFLALHFVFTFLFLQ